MLSKVSEHRAAAAAAILCRRRQYIFIGSKMTAKKARAKKERRIKTENIIIIHATLKIFTRMSNNVLQFVI